MSNQYLVSGLIDAVRDSGMLPEADEEEADARMLGFLNREQRLYLMRLMLSVADANGCNGRPAEPIDAAHIYESGRAGGPGEFSIRNNTIIFTTAPSAEVMRIHYFRRFNKLVAADEASGPITSIDTATL